MKTRVVLFLLAALAAAPGVRAAAPADQVQICTATANSTAAGNLVGCPKGSVSWGPKTTSDLTRTQVNGAQTWAAYSTLTAASQVVKKSNGQWAALGTITVTPTPTAGGGSSGGTTPPSPPTSPPSLSSITLTWAAASLNSDGSPLTDLASYNVYGGTVLANLALLGTVKAPVATFTANPPTAGVWYFTVTAVNSSGQESQQATPISAVVILKSKPASPTGLKATVN